jgi:lysine N6-hydroxylase
MEEFDLLGIGVGPANLSLAALADPLSELSQRFVDTKPEFRWHSGLMLPDSQLTVTFLKDLVSMVEPTSRFSFLNFLVREGRAFRALEANGLGCSRQEFEQYYQWAASQMPSVRWNQGVKTVSLTGGGFEVSCEGGEQYATSTLVLGSGPEPLIPPFAQGLRGDRVLHSGDLMTVRPLHEGLRVVVVGAGQSGAEVVNHLLSDDGALPGSLTWVSGRIGFQPLDDSPFTNEWFAPPFVDHFVTLPPQRRDAVLKEQRLAGADGIAGHLLSGIYQRLYHLDHVLRTRLRHRLLPSRRAVDLRRDGSTFVLTLHDQDRGVTERVPADLVILCTGYSSQIPAYLEPLSGRLPLADGQLQVGADYSVALDAPAGLRLYVQNFAEHTHGTQDRLLSLTAWRSARILNSICGREVYPVDDAGSTVAW